MRATWRWFGPQDPMTIDWIRQSGATSIEASLSHLPPGCLWEADAIDELKRLVQTAPAGHTPLEWDTLGGIANKNGGSSWYATSWFRPSMEPDVSDPSPTLRQTLPEGQKRGRSPPPPMSATSS